MAFQTRNPMHRAHVELTLRALEEIGDARLLIHPVVGMTKPGDVDHYTRVRCYQSVLQAYPTRLAKLALLPLAMRMAGPREAVWHAIIRRNYGCTHLIVGRDHAGPGRDSHGTPFYGPYDAQTLLEEHQDAIGMRMQPSREMVFLPAEQRYVPEDAVPAGAPVARLSGTELRQLLTKGEPIPEWFSFPSVVRELRRTHPPRSHQGFTVFFTGLSGAGKSTIANILLVRLLAEGGRPVTLLDGDLVRAASDVRARLFEGASRPEHSADWLRRVRDHTTWRRGDLRRNCPVRRGPPQGPQHDRAGRRLRAGLRCDAARYL